MVTVMVTYTEDGQPRGRRLTQCDDTLEAFGIWQQWVQEDLGAETYEEVGAMVGNPSWQDDAWQALDNGEGVDLSVEDAAGEATFSILVT